MHNSTHPPTSNAFNDLYPAILECFGIILLGYVAGRTKVISPANSKGLGNYVTYFALPALVFKSMVEMDFSKVNWLFWCSIFISKAVVFVMVYFAALFISRKMDLGKAGIFAIFSSQSNDFALGYPIINSMYKVRHPDFVSYLYLMAPISLAILNPIGFLSMEIQRNRQATRRRSRLAMIGHAVKGLVTNPIIIMVVLGIVGNFAFSHQMPTVITDFLSVLADSFSATALFFLGIGMVGKMKKTTSLFFLAPMLLIGCKLIMMPLVTRQVVLFLQPGGNDTNLTESFSSYGFLYGTIPTAPSVYMFATLFGQSEDVIASSMVLCTFASAPMMFITATMVNLPVQSSAETQYLLSTVMVDVGCVGIACCVWILLVFILSKRFNPIPHHFTFHLVVAQLLASIGIVLTGTVAEHSWVMILKSVVLLFGVFSTRCWAALLAMALCMLRCRSLCSVLRLRLAFYIYGWAVPALLVALIIVVAPPMYVITGENGVFQYGNLQLVASVVVLGINFIIAVTALIVLHRKDRYRHLYNVRVESSTENTGSSDGDSETDRMLKGSAQESNHNLPSDIEDVRTTYQTCSLSTNCSESQRELCRRRTQLHQRLMVKAMEDTDLDPDDIVASHQLGRHIILLLFLLLSMTIGFSVCVWKLSSEAENSLFLMLEFLDTVLTYSQGFFTLAVFGFDTQNVIIPFYNAMRRLLCRKKYRRASQDDEEELDQDTQHTVQQFTQHHIKSCKKDILNDSRVGLQESDEVFRGVDLVDWLVEVGLAIDREAALVYGNRLLIGQVIAHADKMHGGFRDSQAQYVFNYKDDSESEDLQVVM
ncbi:integral membrane protein GPR155-like [Acanthaster planci]|uniref:Integral membrane protein GPR155-like n=1 Tax=Acanthaster planci TaxID=133434 RepID=A0A8B7ZE63_ACAPL|nr:integral membrane protein GPR155-like [Acanthaster planci]